MPNIQIFPDAEWLARAAAEEFIHQAEVSTGLRDGFRVALSGGSTPQAMFRLLAADGYRDRVDWSRVHVFWGDERCVSPSSPESNFYHADRLLLSQVPVPPAQVHRIPAEMEPERAAEAYEETLLGVFSSLSDPEERKHARFDLVILGMGEDGHTASLFPGLGAVHEERRWVSATYVPKLAAWRISLTPALINRALKVIFLVSGSGKANTLQRVIYGAYQPDRYPAQAIHPEGGDLLWMVDEAAAELF